MRRKIGYKNINLSTFLEEVNRDYNKLTGEPVKRNRVMLIKGLLITRNEIEKYDGSMSGI
jgi:hypothetical protein